MDKFYRKFEDIHRGPREQIKERLKVYLPFVKPLQLHYSKPSALDLGCGRGEWLELLTKEGFSARGVDLDEGMLQACKELGLDAEIGDATEVLRSLPDESVSVISAFHVAEHISFNSLVAVIKQAMRVLVPGGVLILETPNVENVVVSTLNFHLDPTHVKPIPPPLLSFTVEYGGFERVKILRLQESPALHDKNFDVGLIDVLDGVSPDYAVVAQKKCDESFMSMFDDAFAKEYGLTLNELTRRYDASIQARMQQAIMHSDQYGQEIIDFLRRLEHMNQLVNAQIDAVNARIERLSEDLIERDARIETLGEELRGRDFRTKTALQAIAEMSDQVQKGKHEAHRWWVAHEEVLAQLDAIKVSRFFKCTQFLRKIRIFYPHPIRATKTRLRSVVLRATKKVLDTPRWRRVAKPIVNKFPFIYKRLFSLAMDENLFGAPNVNVQLATMLADERGLVNHLDKRALRVLSDIKNNIKRTL